MEQFVIIRKPNLYGSEQERARPIMDPDSLDSEVVFESAQDARDEIERIESKTYYLGHNEFGRPEMWVVPMRDWNRNEYMLVHADFSTLDWDKCECGCGECDDCNRWIEDQITDDLRDAEVE